MEEKVQTTKELSELLIQKDGVQVLTLGPNESLSLETGPISCELKGPVQIIINYD